MSAFDRVRDRVDKRRNEKVIDDNGLLYTTMMVFNNFYRIPPSLLEEDEARQLVNVDRTNEAKDLQSKLSYITNWHKTNKKA